MAEHNREKQRLNQENEAHDDEITELKAQLKEKSDDIIHLLTRFKEVEFESKQRLQVIKELQRPKDKKICPFMSQTTVAACRKDCAMWVKGNQHVSDYCTIVKGFGFLQNIGMGE